MQDAATANANMCQLLEEEAAEKEREAREAAKRIKRKLKKAAARLQREEEAKSSATEAAAAQPHGQEDGTPLDEDAGPSYPVRRLHSHLQRQHSSAPTKMCHVDALGSAEKY